MPPCTQRPIPPPRSVVQTVAHVLSALVPELLVMIPALIVAVASMVVAIIAAIKAFVSHQEMDDRNRRSCISAVVVGTAASLLSLCLNPDIIRSTLACLPAILLILAIGIATKGTGIATPGDQGCRLLAAASSQCEGGTGDFAVSVQWGFRLSSATSRHPSCRQHQCACRCKSRSCPGRRRRSVILVPMGHDQFGDSSSFRRGSTRRR